MISSSFGALSCDDDKLIDIIIRHNIGGPVALMYKETKKDCNLLVELGGNSGTKTIKCDGNATIAHIKKYVFGAHVIGNPLNWHAVRLILIVVNNFDYNVNVVKIVRDNFYKFYNLNTK